MSDNTPSDFHNSVRVASTANLASLTGLTAVTMDAVALAVDDRVLLKDQATASQNGLYRYVEIEPNTSPATFEFVRAEDGEHGYELSSGAVVVAEAGTAGGNKMYILTTDDPIEVGTTGQTWLVQA